MTLKIFLHSLGVHNNFSSWTIHYLSNTSSFFVMHFTKTSLLCHSRFITQTSLLCHSRFITKTSLLCHSRFITQTSLLCVDFSCTFSFFCSTGVFFAVKEVSLLDQGTQGKQSIYQLEQEISLLSQFEHENIVLYYGTERDESTLYIFLELVKGSLLNLYQTYNLKDSQVSAYTRQILRGLKYLHDRNVIHRDIKCANILVHTSGSVKLADFGLAKATKLNDVKSCKGTAFWMAPEVVNSKGQGYGLPADIWSLGCTVLEMLTGKIPYSDLEWMQAMYKIGNSERPYVPETLSEEARDFILQCLRVNPNDRPTAGRLLDHPFVKVPLTTYSCPASPYIGRRS